MNPWRAVRRMTATVPVLIAAGCAPLSAPPPVHFLETARVIDRGAVAVTAGLGAGELGFDGQGSGAGARARYGVAGVHEAGAEFLWVGLKNDDTKTASHPWLGNTSVFSGKLGWKTAVTGWAAVEAGVGGSHAATGNAVGGDLACLVSAPERGKPLRPYLGLRIAYVTPAGRGTDEAGGPTRMTVAALGLAYRVTPKYRLLLELASLRSTNTGYPATAADPYRTLGTWVRTGSYGAIGLERSFGDAPLTAGEIGR